MKATAQVYSEPCRWPRQVLRRRRLTGDSRMGNVALPPSAWAPSMVTSALRDRIFGENVAEPFQRLVRCRLRRHPFLDHVGCRRTPDLLGVRFGVAGVKHGVVRYRRLEQALAGVGYAMRILGIEPEGIALDQLRHRREPAAEPVLEILVHHLRLDQVLEELLGDLGVLRALGHEGTADAEFR